MNKEDIRDKPVQYVKGVGPQKARLLANLDIYTLGDLLYHFPREYQDRTRFQPAIFYEHNSTAVVKGKVVGSQDLKPRSKLTVTKVALHDGTGVFYAVWFNQSYIKKQLPAGTEVIVTGKMDRSYGSPQVNVSEYEIIRDDQQLLNAGRIVPVYPLTEKLTQRYMRQVIYGVLEEWAGEISEFLPGYLLQKYELVEIKEALQQIHFPRDMSEARRSRRRFVFEELFVLQLGLALRKGKYTRREKEHRYDTAGNLVNEFIMKLDFELTGAQKRVWEEIKGDMLSPHPMNRLIQGDVGSGKTIVGALALLKASENGFQGALMAPTEVLAEQHYVNLKQLLNKMGIEVALLSGSMTSAEKNRVLTETAAGRVHVVVGTHALLQEEVVFYYLSLVIVDEQHRFGVRQRASLQYKGMTPDVLVMTATPIPRTMAMTLYGDLDISVIDEMPPGRQPVHTYAIKPSAIEKAYSLVRGEVEKEHQVYIVCALVEESDKLDVQPAVETASQLQKEVFPDYSVGLLHGRMSSDDKEETMNLFRDGYIDILVSTSVIEVGVDVHNATVMIIQDAHRFGLAQLHQLRGRVGRGKSRSYCILVSEAGTKEAKERLRAMTETTDGFKLAEKDMQIRGPGEFFGTRQSGMPALKIADLVEHAKVMEITRGEAVKLQEDDPELSGPQNKILKLELQRRLNREGNYIDIS